MKYKVGDYVRILNNQNQIRLYKTGDIGKITVIDDGTVKVLFNNGNAWWVFCEGDTFNGEVIKAEDCFEVLDPMCSSIIEQKIQDIVSTANGIAHIRGCGEDILPATQLIDKMLDILKEHGILHELTLP